MTRIEADIKYTKILSEHNKNLKSLFEKANKNEITREEITKTKNSIIQDFDDKIHSFIKEILQQLPLR